MPAQMTCFCLMKDDKAAQICLGIFTVHEEELFKDWQQEQKQNGGMVVDGGSKRTKDVINTRQRHGNAP